MTESASPRAWRAYCTVMRARGQKPDSAFSRFRGRYRLAASFETATFSHLGPDAQAGYSSLLRLALSYGALESLCRALRREISQEPLPSAELAQRLRDRRSARIVGVMRSDARPFLVTALDRLIGDDSVVDVMPAAAFYRHLFLHGHLTATRAGTGRSAWERGIVDSLADQLLVTADERFAEHVEGLG